MDSKYEDNDVKNRIPPDLVKATEGAYGALQPKSKRRYERTYNEFEGWRKRNGAVSLSERTLLLYFGTLRESNKPTTLWAYYSMLKSTLNLNNGVDISTFAKLTAFLKRQSEGYRPKKAKVFTEEEMRLFISEAPDKEWLVVKVACIFGLCGALRTDDFTKITSSDVKMYCDMAYVRVNDTKSKEPPSFIVTGDFFKIVKKYADLRPPKVLTNRFFINYRNGKCTAQVIGKNKFSKMPWEIATYLELEEAHKYTGQAFRRTSATVAANRGATLETPKTQGGWKSGAVAQKCTDDSLMYKKRVGDVIKSAINVKAKKADNSKKRRNPGERTNNSMFTIENDEINRAPAGHPNPIIHFNEGHEILVHSTKLQCADVGPGVITSHSVGNVIEFPRPNGLGESSANPFSFNNCNVTINYYQK